MKVAFVDQTGDVIGGAQESLALLLTHLPSDIEPVVILFREGPFAERLRAAGLFVEVTAISSAIASSTRDRVSPRGLLTIPRVMLQLARLLRKHRVDLVYTNTVKAHFLAIPAAKLANLPSISHLRDLLEGKSNAALRAILRLTDRQIAISSTVARSHGLAADAVVPNPVDLERYAALPDRDAARRDLALPNREYVIFAIVGRINRWKGHDRFLRAAARASETMDGLRFVIVGEPRFGDADYVDELKGLASELGIASQVSFLPWQADLPRLYAAIDVLVNCSKREPFGRTIIEAGAANVPSICLDDSGAAEFMTEAGLEIVVPAADDAALAAAIERFGRDAKVREAAGLAAKRWSRLFDANAHAMTIAEIVRAAKKRR